MDPAFADRREAPEPRFAGGYPEWPALDRLSQTWTSRLAWVAAYTAFYIAVDPAFQLMRVLGRLGIIELHAVAASP